MIRQSFLREGLRLAWAQQGKGKPFVFQHGLGANITQAFSLLGPLTGQWEIIAMDCRAHGESSVGDPSALSFNTFADDLAALLDVLGLESVVLGGLSMGAGISLNFAIRHPQRVSALILLRPAWLDRPMDVRSWYREAARLIRESGPERGREAFLQSKTYDEIALRWPGTAESIVGQFASPRAVDGVARLERLPDDVPNANRAEWVRLPMPALVMGHHDDPVHPFECATTIAETIPNARFAEVVSRCPDPASHEDSVRRAITAFLGG